MTHRGDAAKAEQLSRRRARAAPILGAVFVAQQASYVAGFGNGARTVDHVQVGAWLVLSVVLLLALYTGGGWIYSRRVRELANDEATRAHRDDALGYGFLVGMASCIAVYALTLFEEVSGRDAVHIVLTFGIGTALLRYGYLERRAVAGE